MRLMETKILLRGLRLYARHGVLPHEREQGNWFTIDVEAEVDLTQAMHTDNLADTVSYADLYDTIAREMATPSRLVEHVAARIARSLLSEYPAIRHLRLQLLKDNPPIPGIQCTGCGVIIDTKNNTLNTTDP